jgi:hypothetical protein
MKGFPIMGIYSSEDVGMAVKNITIDGDQWIAGYPMNVTINLKGGGSVNGLVMSSFGMDRLIEAVQYFPLDIQKFLPWVHDASYVPPARDKV